MSIGTGDNGMDMTNGSGGPFNGDYGVMYVRVLPGNECHGWLVAVDHVTYAQHIKWLDVPGAEKVPGPGDASASFVPDCVHGRLA